ncbi:unnamed protein product [Sphagnum compactum]
MFESSVSPFGAPSSSSPFGATSAASNPVGSTTNPFAMNQSGTPFGAKAFARPPLCGGQTGTFPFGSGTATGVFGVTQPTTFGASSRGLDASTSSPVFGSGTSLFGSGTATSVFGVTQPTTSGASSGGLGASTPSPAFQSGTSLLGSGTATGFFGVTQPTMFGASSGSLGAPTPSPTFRSGTSLLGIGTATSVFGVTQPTPFGASSGGLGASTPSPAFGSGAHVFGQKPASSVGGFGATQPQASIFGSSASGQTQALFSSQPFGSTSPAFGAQSAVPFGSTVAPTFVASPTQQQQPGSRVAPYAATPDLDSQVALTFVPQVQKFMSISAMPAYKNKSHEELRMEDHQAGDKGGPNMVSSQQSGLILQAASPSGGTSIASPGQTPTPDPSLNFLVNSTSCLTTPIFGHPPPAYQSSTSGTTKPLLFASTSASGQSSTSPAFALGSTGSPGQVSTPAVGSRKLGSSTSAFGESTSGISQLVFPSALGFGLSSPAPGFNTVSPFGRVSLSGNTQSSPAGGLVQSSSSQPLGATTAPALGSTMPVFTNNPFTSSSASISAQIKVAELAQSTNLMSETPVPVTNPFGTLPALTQMPNRKSAGSGPSVQYGISSMPRSEKPTQVQTISLLTPRHITQQSKVHIHARRYHPKKDSPKVSFFSDADEVLTTPKADLVFIPRENPRALFIRQPDQTSLTPRTSKSTTDVRDIAMPVQGNGESGPPESWPAPEKENPALYAGPITSTKTSEIFSRDQVSQTNGVFKDQSQRAKGFFSKGGVDSSEFLKNSHARSSAIEALMPKLLHSDYFTEPGIQELAAKEQADPGYSKQVVDFVVGRQGYGVVKFFGVTDVQGLDLESIIKFNYCEVIVYMDESKKPVVGQGLNKPAQVTLLNVKCADKKSGQQYSDGPEVEKFEKRLKKKTEEQGAEFISYSALKGEWKFQVQHFSRYGLDTDSDEEDASQSDQERAHHLSGTE